MKSTVNEHQENLIKVLMKVFMFVDMESKGLMLQKNPIWRKKHLHWDLKIPLKYFGTPKKHSDYSFRLVYAAMP